MNFKIFFLLPLLMVSFNSSEAKIKKKKRKPASIPYESVETLYESQSNLFSNFKIHLSPFSNYITFQAPTARHLKNSDGSLKTVYMDCYPKDQNTKWQCLGGCEGGDLSIVFLNGSQLNRFSIEAFESFTPRACDGSESREDQSISSSSSIEFNVRSVRLPQ